MKANLIEYYAHEYQTGEKNPVKSAKKALKRYDNVKHNKPNISDHGVNPGNIRNQHK